MKNCSRRKTSGFSLIEMLLVITVIATIATITIRGISSISNAAKKAQIDRQIQQMMTDFAYARSMSVEINLPLSGATGKEVVEVYKKGLTLPMMKVGGYPIENEDVIAEQISFDGVQGVYRIAH